MRTIAKHVWKRLDLTLTYLLPNLNPFPRRLLLILFYPGELLSYLLSRISLNVLVGVVQISIGATLLVAPNYIFYIWVALNPSHLFILVYALWFILFGLLLVYRDNNSLLLRVFTLPLMVHTVVDMLFMLAYPPFTALHIFFLLLLFKTIYADAPVGTVG